MGSLLSTTPTSEDAYGGAASTGLIVGAMGVSMILSKITHNMVIGAGTQPTTICAEFKAAEVTRGLAKPMESNPDRRMMQNPIANTSYDWETGRAPKYMYKKGDSIVMEGDA